MDDKLQICVTFKHTVEEEYLYEYINSKSSKSAFIKDLVKAHITSTNVPIVNISDTMNKTPRIQESTRVSYGTKTKQSFLA